MNAVRLLINRMMNRNFNLFETTFQMYTASALTLVRVEQWGFEKKSRESGACETCYSRNRFRDYLQGCSAGLQVAGNHANSIVNDANLC